MVAACINYTHLPSSSTMTISAVVGSRDILESSCEVLLRTTVKLSSISRTRSSTIVMLTHLRVSHSPNSRLSSSSAVKSEGDSEQ